MLTRLSAQLAGLSAKNSDRLQLLAHQGIQWVAERRRGVNGVSLTARCVCPQGTRWVENTMARRSEERFLDGVEWQAAQSRNLGSTSAQPRLNVGSTSFKARRWACSACRACASLSTSRSTWHSGTAHAGAPSPLPEASRSFPSRPSVRTGGRYAASSAPRASSRRRRGAIHGRLLQPTLRTQGASPC